ncbi:putative S-(hydroxymethyl)glutathione dehydrogenase [Glarea lozoyensis 74030]|uniref:Putative S-(Hydroxymethyl)glutathione dehydrogenase n=1 Tax=Glarea lozoyensis (strain ATCC 74030 / MF5533) TaxID=1104152 RepID=H0EHK9_GLAL7|nr:putative S-(hydroxymethyl)glutathione dehydrogenase [Glarea lozoyensis 74030]
MAEAHHQKIMKAVKWDKENRSVKVEKVKVPKIQHPLDAIVRITSAAICGTDLHTTRGRIEMDDHLTFGHESMGIIDQIGDDVSSVKVGDRVVISGLANKIGPNGSSILYGTFGTGDYGVAETASQEDGGQAEFMQVPYADDNLFPVPAGKGSELDYLLLADIFPTAWFALERAEQVIGDTVVVFGAGPVGLLCAYSAFLRGAVRVYSVDNVPERLAKAKSIGAIPINFSHGPADEQILKLEPQGVDRCCDCVGFECLNEKGENVENTVINWAVNVTRLYGGIGQIGVYVPKDIDVLLKLIQSGKAKPSFVFTNKFNIDDAVKAYDDFGNRKLIKAVFQFPSKEHSEAEAEN